ncbi:polysaccharide pyruvyl transferase WcaK-like protein [Methanococcus maripaludis]|uniref:Polysaccharide pyruvyl transferase WcaK-like protein n=1 Tax=Methanococcus maripaludis TaxID=39152 RepID=A0A7J9NIM4_METMI|nr:polysaccharide pyruvyl transferase family protein [Methanococcus maripaludis]MBA2840765.1 polysaccharide pyruvyl transferase WcaK-like protein [Methanococcus maripaludis]
MKNVLFSTTRQWNPGDEFILLGCMNLLKEVIGEFNPIIYNRNPEVRQAFDYLNPLKNSKFFKKNNVLESFLRVGFWDNSFKEDTNAECIDLVVFAGSPEWRSRRLIPLYRKIIKYDIPTIYLGIGSSNYFEYNKLNKIYRQVLENSKLITVRDSITEKCLKNVKPYRMPCPALFSSPFEKNIEKVEKVGLMFGSKNAVSNNNVSKKTYDFLISEYSKIIERYGNFEVVCHYIDEISEACNIYGRDKVSYSYDSKDYLDIYKNYDVVIGHRVHGVGISASMGIPGILIAHDLRADAGRGFLAEIMNLNSANNILGSIEKIENNIHEKNNELKIHKLRYKQEYHKLFQEYVM